MIFLIFKSSNMPKYDCILWYVELLPYCLWINKFIKRFKIYATEYYLPSAIFLPIMVEIEKQQLFHSLLCQM